MPGLSVDKASDATGIAAISTTLEPVTEAIVSDYLLTHGIYPLSWLEIIQVIGALYILSKLIVVVVSIVKGQTKKN